MTTTESNNETEVLAAADDGFLMRRVFNTLALVSADQFERWTCRDAVEQYANERTIGLYHAIKQLVEIGLEEYQRRSDEWDNAGRR